MMKRKQYRRKLPPPVPKLPPPIYDLRKENVIEAKNVSNSLFLQVNSRTDIKTLNENLKVNVSTNNGSRYPVLSPINRYDKTRKNNVKSMSVKSLTDQAVAARKQRPNIIGLSQGFVKPKSQQELPGIKNNIDIKGLASRAAAARKQRANVITLSQGCIKHEPELKESKKISRRLGKGYGMFTHPWVKETMIGRGQFGTVYTAMDLHSNKIIAVKQVSIQSREMLENMRDEVTLMCRASFRNPNVVECMGWSVSDDSDDGEYGIVVGNSSVLSQIHTMTDELDMENVVGKNFNIFMEYVKRGSIAALLKKSGAIHECAARNYMRQLLLGLRSLHAAGIAHRDIKCQNLLLTDDNTLKVADFGCAKWVEGNQAAGIQGSIPWLSPEVIKQEVGNRKSGDYDEASALNGWKKADVWAVGCTYIEMITGKPPWNNYSNPAAAMYNIATCKAPPQLPAGKVHPDGYEFVELCCNIVPDNRPHVSQLIYHKYMKTENINEHGQYVGEERTRKETCEISRNNSVSQESLLFKGLDRNQKSILYSL